MTSSRPRTAGAASAGRGHSPTTDDTTKPYIPSPMPADPRTDDRITWIRTKVESGLMIEFDKAAHLPQHPNRIDTRESQSTATTGDLFWDCLERDNRINLQRLMDFLEDNEADGATASALLVWAERFMEKIEVIKAPSLESVQVDGNDVLATDNADVGAGAEGEEHIRGSIYGEQARSGAAPQGWLFNMGSKEFHLTPNHCTISVHTDEKRSTPGAPAIAPETSAEGEGTVLAGEGHNEESHPKPRKIITIDQESYRLHLCVQKLPEQVAEVNSVYFLRNKSGPIPLPASLEGRISERFSSVSYASPNVLFLSISSC